MTFKQSVRSRHVSRYQAGIEAAVMLGVLYAFVATAGLTGVFWVGPAGVVAACGVVLLYMRASGAEWESIGLRRPTGLARAAGWILTGVLIIAAVSAVLQPLLSRLFGPLTLDAFANIRGDEIALVGVLIVSWSTAALGEEVLFRGFLFHRLVTCIGDSRRGVLVTALPAQALFFALAHIYQGISGAILVFVIGLLMGLLFMVSRSLWIPILVHGTIDTLSLTAIYFGAGIDGQTGG